MQCDIDMTKLNCFWRQILFHWCVLQRWWLPPERIKKGVRTIPTMAQACRFPTAHRIELSRPETALHLHRSNHSNHEAAVFPEPSARSLVFASCGTISRCARGRYVSATTPEAHSIRRRFILSSHQRHSRQRRENLLRPANGHTSV